MSFNNKMYQQMDNESDVLKADSHRLIQLLFEKCQFHLANAKNFAQANNQQKKSEALLSAVNIIEYLRSCLVKNDEMTEKMAGQLEPLYTYSINELTKAYHADNIEHITAVMKVMDTLKSAWDEIAETVKG